jgi:hypothetical protein
MFARRPPGMVTSRWHRDCAVKRRPDCMNHLTLRSYLSVVTVNKLFINSVMEPFNVGKRPLISMYQRPALKCAFVSRSMRTQAPVTMLCFLPLFGLVADEL